MTSDAAELERVREPSEELTQANGKLKWGVGLGVFAAASYALLGTVCPLCLIASPALIGAGLFGRAKAKRS